MNNHCFHGGGFWNSLDQRFRSSEGMDRVINADVLDAWFPPSHQVLEALSKFLPYWPNTSPPTGAEGLIAEIAEQYQCPPDEILTGAGSSALWFLFALTFIKPSSRVLLIEPSYGEYAHVCQNVVGCATDHLVLSVEDEFVLDFDQWVQKVNSNSYDLAVLVNPNNPTGQAIPRQDLLNAIAKVPTTTQVLIDEAYMDFWNPDESLLHGELPSNVTVISSFSKRFALSGLRVAMLRTSEARRRELAMRTPPWAVSMPAQIAACAALRDPDYYQSKYAETQIHRARLKLGLEDSGYRTIDSGANWLLFKVSDAERFCRQMQSKGLFVRNAGLTAPSLGNEWIRIAVKDEATLNRMLDIIS